MKRLGVVPAFLLASAAALAQQRFPAEIIKPEPLLEADVETRELAIQAERDGNMKEAIRLYTRAARNGNGKAAYRIGEIYEKGVGGVSRDYEQALKWYNAARVLGYNP